MEQFNPITASVPDSSGEAFIKTALRRALRAIRERIEPDDARNFARAAADFLLADPHWASARQVALYMAMPHELSTVPLIKEAWAKGKRVWLPRCLPKKPGHPGHMDFVRCDSFEDLVPGIWGILEPGSHCAVFDPALDAAPDLLVMPAVGLDLQGNRLGQGGGYYDHLLRLPLWANVPRIGLVFACQLVPKLPHEPWDQPVAALLSEEGLTWL